jgi:ribose 5-phosphate isomerase B
MKIAIASDHAGFKLKEEITLFFKEVGLTIEDKGTFSEDSCDYPDFALKLAQEVADGKAEKGIFICGTGIGGSITANKVKGIRAALCHDEFTAKMSREHNDSNILCLGSRVLTKDKAFRIVDIWLKTKFAGDRHQRRIDLISKIEEGK